LRTRQANRLALGPDADPTTDAGGQNWILTLTRLQAGFDSKFEA